MAQQRIGGTISTEVLEFDPELDPQKHPAVFEVTVLNRSDQFASFQVELLASGADPEIGHSWYKFLQLDTVKKPPGDTSVFRIQIFEAPIPGVRMINITVLVRSMEFPDVLRHGLRLLIRPKPGIRLKMELPKEEFTAKPREIVPVPVRLFNLSQQPADLVLRFVGLDASWLKDGDQLRVMLHPGQQKEVTFHCQPPVAARAPSQTYPFSVVAYVMGSEMTRASGVLKVLPVGMVMFNCEPEEHSIPPQGKFWPTWRSDPVVYDLNLKNASNVPQTVSILMQGRDVEHCTHHLNVDQQQLRTGEGQAFALEVQKRRPLFGFTRTLQLEAVPDLSDQRLGETDPASQILKLILKPILPAWLQLLLLLLLALLILALLPSEHHTGPVNAVRFSGVVEPILSGSEDQTVRAWRDTSESWPCRILGWRRFCLEANGVLVTEAQTDNKGVTALRYQPENNELIAIGLENGLIQLWDVRQAIQIGSDFIEAREARNDRVLDLLFTQDSRFLFSAHGSGILRRWDLNADSDLDRLLSETRLGFATYTLALSQDERERILVAAGRENSIMLWEWQDEPEPLPLVYPVGSRNDYIYSIVTAAPNLLIAADTKGFITLWDLDRCSITPAGDAYTCFQLDQWRLTSGNDAPIPLRAIDLVQTDDGYYYLGAASDDGTIRLWRLLPSGTRDQDFTRDRERGLVMARYLSPLKNLDLILRRQRLLAVTGADDTHVRIASRPVSSQSVAEVNQNTASREDSSL